MEYKTLIALGILIMTGLLCPASNPAVGTHLGIIDVRSLRAAWFRLLALVAVLLLASVQAFGARVAVVDLTKAPDRADLLTVALAKTDGIEVLERAQMDKLVAEQQLQALESGGKFSALGKLVGADGL